MCLFSLHALSALNALLQHLHICKSHLSLQTPLKPHLHEAFLIPLLPSLPCQKSFHPTLLMLCHSFLICKMDIIMYYYVVSTL